MASLDNKPWPFFRKDSFATNFSDEQAWFIRHRQIWAMAIKWPDFEIIYTKEPSALNFQKSFIPKTVWIGPLQPSDLSRVYLVEVHFAPVATEYPLVKIVDPEIPYHKDIHMFLRHRNLCLFDSRTPLCSFQSPRQAYTYWEQTGIWPGNSEWNVMSLIADTTIPWAAEWLLQYEAWKITGEWHGGGHYFNELSFHGSLKLHLRLRRLYKSIMKKERLLKNKIKNAA